LRNEVSGRRSGPIGYHRGSMLTGYQRACLGGAERALRRFGVRAVCEFEPAGRFELREPGRPGRCLRMRFEATQHACELFLNPHEVSIRCVGYVHVLRLAGDPATRLDATLTELLDACASGLGPEPALLRAERGSRGRVRSEPPYRPRPDTVV
jgi:hypothetical protein